VAGWSPSLRHPVLSGPFRRCHRLVGGALCYGPSTSNKAGIRRLPGRGWCSRRGGTWGAIATGLFASKLINSAGADGLFFGNPGQLGTQVVSVLAAWVYSFAITWIILKVLDATMGLKVAEEDESEAST